MIIKLAFTRRRRSLLTCIALSVVLMGTWRMTARAQGGNEGWSQPVDITQPSDAHHTQFGIIRCDQYQNAHVFWVDNIVLDDGIPAIFYRNDASGAWSVPNAIITPPGSATFLRAEISEISDTVHLLWMNGSGNVPVYHSTAPVAEANDARAWLRPELLVEQAESAALQIDRLGTIHLIYVKPDSNSTQHDVFYMQSGDDGLTWSAPAPVATLVSTVPSGVQLEMAVDGRGRIHVGISSRSQDYGVGSSVGYVRSIDGGKTWTEYRLIQDEGTTFQGVAWIAPFAFGDDEVFLTWHDARRMYQRSTDGGESWSSPAEIMPLPAGFGGANPIVQDSGGNLHVVIAAAEAVYVLDWRDQRWDLPQRIEDRRLDPHGQNLAVCQGNQLHVVYFDLYVGVKGHLIDSQNRVWWAVRKLDTPWIAPQELPAPKKPTVAASAIPTASIAQGVTTVAPTRAPQIEGRANTTERPAPSNSTMNTLLIALVPVFVLVLSVVVFARRK
ncbi:MAG: exo-alpha-sialidase [Anaerolineae bacterium]|nr:exo-alpha-sialidase [Anaerolineae bacterium]